MKNSIRNILLGALVFISVTVNGQDGLLKKSDMRVMDYDTVKTVMLVCDTVFIPFTTQIVARVNDYKIGNGIGRVPYVYWQFGYKVYKFVRAGWDNEDNQYPDHYTLFEWLDENKKTISKSIIVWQSIQIK